MHTTEGEQGRDSRQRNTGARGGYKVGDSSDTQGAGLLHLINQKRKCKREGWYCRTGGTEEGAGKGRGGNPKSKWLCGGAPETPRVQRSGRGGLGRGHRPGKQMGEDGGVGGRMQSRAVAGQAVAGCAGRARRCASGGGERRCWYKWGKAEGGREGVHCRSTVRGAGPRGGRGVEGPLEGVT